ncbi:hypothetical protein [Propionibacterium acidifaciens]|uniref:hypothetical protein n=1 Tax=Propionibacterium acidifaciens TaxID=556499 RepID=UPI000F50A77B|nr:hypothetical protein [Propionibacterium acidifaciens]
MTRTPAVCSEPFGQRHPPVGGDGRPVPGNGGLRPVEGVVEADTAVRRGGSAHGSGVPACAAPARCEVHRRHGARSAAVTSRRNQ